MSTLGRTLPYVTGGQCHSWHNLWSLGVSLWVRTVQATHTQHLQTLQPLWSCEDAFLPQFFRVSRGWFVGSGSGVVTSSPAAAIWPLAKAWYRSSWFTTSPLEHRGDVGAPQFPAPRLPLRQNHLWNEFSHQPGTCADFRSRKSSILTYRLCVQ